MASLDYRLSGEARFPAPLEDVAAGLGWLRTHAEHLGIDPTRIVLWGESAGGHLAALLGLTDPGVRAVVDWYGPADLTTVAADAAAGGISAVDPGAPDSREALLLGVAPSSDPERARAASPVTHVHADAPPFLLLHGTADRLVPTRQSERLGAALDERRRRDDARAVRRRRPPVARQARRRPGRLRPVRRLRPGAAHELIGCCFRCVPNW